MLSKSDIKRWLVEAIARFNDKDAAALLCPRLDDYGYYVQGGSGWGGAGERAIAHRLAVYLEAAAPKRIRAELQLSVDCEYNRHLGAGKVHTIPKKLVQIVEDAKRKVKPASDSIAPDVIIHRRGVDDYNLLVIELKKDSNPEIPEYDNLKLECFTAQEPGYDYRVGAKVTAHDQVDPDERSLEVTAWYADGKCQAEEEI